MLQGTGSDVGKSLLVAGLARAFTRHGLVVRPFKPQNMSNNAAVTADGGEIGRAQALQARACGVAPSIHMNPVLLKPQSSTGSQIVVQGRVIGQAQARDYHALKPQLLPRVLESFAILEAQADLVLVEGAGSAAEINLRAGDIANMGFAEAADVPVVLVGDIDRGGVIAALVGTCEILAERARLKGFIVNKLRGDPTLFAAGERFIAERTGLRAIGTVPFFAAASRLPAEDSVALDRREPTPTPTLYRPAGEGARLRDLLPLPQGGGGSGWGWADAPFLIAVPRLPHIANFDDLDPLAAEPGVIVDMVASGRPLPRDAGLILLPGSKATRADLAALRAEGWDIDILAHRRQGRPVLGLCGGYQMLGRSVADPEGIEGPAGSSMGLGLLPIDTVLGRSKRLEPIDAIDDFTGHRIQGYEMHMGRTTGEAAGFLSLAGRPEGAMSADGLVQGSYIHGLFSGDAYRRWYLGRLGVAGDPSLGFEAEIDRTLDELADHLGRHLDLAALLTIARERG